MSHSTGTRHEIKKVKVLGGQMAKMGSRRVSLHKTDDEDIFGLDFTSVYSGPRFVCTRRFIRRETLAALFVLIPNLLIEDFDKWGK